MGFFAKLRKTLSGGSRAQPDTGLYFYVKLDRSGEIVRVRLDLSREINPDYEQGGFVSHKSIIGPRTFLRAEATFRFDEARRLVDWEVAGGSPSTQQEWETQEAASGQG
jgi:hypothetical protein